jgi:hypothetical protein
MNITNESDVHFDHMMKHMITHMLVTRLVCGVHDDFVNKLIKEQVVFSDVILRTIFTPLMKYARSYYDDVWEVVLGITLSYFIENENESYEPFVLYKQLLNVIDDPYGEVIRILKSYKPYKCYSTRRRGRVTITFSPEKTKSSYDITNEYYVRSFRYNFFCLLNNIHL